MDTFDNTSDVIPFGLPEIQPTEAKSQKTHASLIAEDDFLLAGVNSDYVPFETTQGIDSGSAGVTSVGTSKFHPFANSTKRRRRGTGPEVNGMSMKDVADALSSQIATEPVDLPCPPGFQVTVYNGDISQHFNLASETVQITRGSIKYVDHHARYGPQTRFRFQLCHNYLQRKCTKLSECSYIHATVLPKPSEVHLNPFAPRRLAADRHGHGHDVPLSAQDDPSVAEAYDTLPPGMTFKVYAPNDNGTTTPQMIASDMIIVTAGAVSARRGVDTHCRHCAHYQFKRLCHLGSRCHFIHSKVPFSGHTAFHTAPPTSQR